ncbi:MAG: hypothetical protein GKR90_27410 [Pseudomonadales bacterium]|nr:hypothetical protein [Pseudomonadales bacterium]
MLTKRHVSTDIRLHVLAYNMKRTIDIHGDEGLDRGYARIAHVSAKSELMVPLVRIKTLACAA